jgi:hypothetical protein
VNSITSAHCGTIAIIVPYKPRGGVVVVEDYIQQFNELQQIILAASQKHQQEVLESRLAKSPPHPTTFDVGDYVGCSYPIISGPLIVLEREGNIYTIQDTALKTIEKVHVSRLKLLNIRNGVDPAEIAALDQGLHLVESIVDHKGPKNGRPKRDLSFKVRWLGYSPDSDTWEPYANVSKTEALQNYAKNHPQLKL